MARDVIVVEATQEMRFADHHQFRRLTKPGRYRGAAITAPEAPNNYSRRAHLVQSAADFKKIVAGLFQTNIWKYQDVENID